MDATAQKDPVNGASIGPAGRPSEFTMPIQGGMLEALGINMYTTLGKCLVEFLANSYDGEARQVDIQIPTEAILEARKAIRQRAREDVAAGLRDRFDVLLQPLPDEMEVVISDNGHGMTCLDVQDKFLPLNRKRRADGAGGESALSSENGKRFVMGRKGLGKLAGFGAAENVRIWTKREGETFATVITLRDRDLKAAPNITSVPIPAEYDEGLDQSIHGTTITLSGLKSDAVKERPETLEATILESFNAIRPEEMSILMNGKLLEPRRPDYEFTFPPSLDADGYANSSVAVEDIGDIGFRYYVGFLPRDRHLPARKRGARVYCNNRLAAGPSLFGLGTGMHSFHSADYMECVVEADELDRVGVDFVNTNRSTLREDNEVVRAFLEKITGLMGDAVRDHGRFRERQAAEKLKADPKAKIFTDIVATLPRKTRKPASKLLHALATEFGVGTPEFDELAPAFVNSVNASEVLVRLIRLSTNPETIGRIASHLRELGEMERLDVLKLYRGRRRGIGALRTLIDKGEAEWKKKGLEAELHGLLKECPWLIRPEYSNYLSSDQDLNKVVTLMARSLGIDRFSPVLDDGHKDDTRPDLVFLLTDPSYGGPFTVHVVELKSPTLPLTMEHHAQLSRYLFQVRDWCSAELSHSVAIHGYLIGAMPPADAKAVGQRQLLEAFSRSGPRDEIRIIGLEELIKNAWDVHMEAINALERDAGDDGDEDDTPSPGSADPEADASLPA